jgi:hypothetical protein
MKENGFYAEKRVLVCVCLAEVIYIISSAVIVAVN